jgi:hypothetical protein
MNDRPIKAFNFSLMRLTGPAIVEPNRNSNDYVRVAYDRQPRHRLYAVCQLQGAGANSCLHQCNQAMSSLDQADLTALISRDFLIFDRTP